MDIHITHIKLIAAKHDYIKTKETCTLQKLINNLIVTREKNT